MIPTAWTTIALHRRPRKPRGLYAGNSADFVIVSGVSAEVYSADNLPFARLADQNPTGHWNDISITKIRKGF